MPPHSSTLAWKIPGTGEPGRLQSMGSLRVGHDWVTSLSLSCTGEGNGNPLLCSCLENPRDGGAWWAAVHGVAKSRTWLKQLSSSSSRQGKRKKAGNFLGPSPKNLVLWHPPNPVWAGTAIWLPVGWGFSICHLVNVCRVGGCFYISVAFRDRLEFVHLWASSQISRALCEKNQILSWHLFHKAFFKKVI